jgi:hypothetical protein
MGRSKARRAEGEREVEEGRSGRSEVKWRKLDVWEKEDAIFPRSEGAWGRKARKERSSLPVWQFASSLLPRLHSHSHSCLPFLT